MAIPIFLASILSFISFHSPFLISTILAQSQPFDFTFNGFNESIDNLTRVEATVIKPSGALRLTNQSYDVIGHAFFANPFPFLETNSSNTTSANVSSFSTYFVFQIVPVNDRRGDGGYGLAFTLSPLPRFPGGQGGHYLGVFNETNNGQSSNNVFMVEFDTVTGFEQNSSANGNHVGVNINGVNSTDSEPAAYYNKIDSNNKEEFDLQSGPVQAWIDYDGPNKTLNVTVSPLSVPKPSRPLISREIDLSSVIKEEMYAGFSASTGQKRSSHYILGWSFRLNGIANPLNISKLPILPVESNSSSFNPNLRKALIAIFSTVMLFLLVGLFVSIHKRRTSFEVLEEWELDCPRRLSYKDLHKATNGFKQSGLIGSGGFGKVYRGKLRGGAEVAVKRIASNSVQGIREFVAEIESLGRLRHKNLLNLQGWCKNKNDLLLVYDYVPNGSLDNLLYSQEMVLDWEQRFNIIKGIGSGLLYLHEEWEQVVIHRDVKSSNVLVDAEMNGRLGDFGLARLYDRNKISYTTNVVGTIGYIAPELTRTGKASTGSDVFAYGVLLLEIVCGKTPILYDPARGHVPLVDWVVECLESRKIRDLVDPKLSNVYVFDEVELVVGLGLICSNHRQESRPTMRQVVKYLNGDDLLPRIRNPSSFSSRPTSETVSDFSALVSGDIPNTMASFEVISSGAIPVSYRSSSIGEMSSSSFESGR